MSTLAVALETRSPARVSPGRFPSPSPSLGCLWSSTTTRRFSWPTVWSWASPPCGFNLLLGYTGLLSFGHSAYFGVGAYVVALMVKYLGVASMELFPDRLYAIDRGEMIFEGPPARPSRTRLF